MTYPKCSSVLLFFLCTAIAVVLVGCQPEKPMPVRQCPGKDSTDQALAALETSALQLRPFVAYGSGQVSFYEEKKSKPRNEKIPTIKLWFEPPGNMRFWGDVAFNPRGLDVGSNEREFWLAAKPKEIGNVYIWGLWSEQTDATEMMLSPAVLLQALGVPDAGEDQVWSFSPDKSGDMLTLYNADGHIARKVHIDNCRYRISSIEYFNFKQELATTLRLGDYRDVDGMFVSAEITIINHNYDGTEDTFDIRLKSVEPADKIKKGIFERPDTKGFEEVDQIRGDRIIRLKQPQ
jgi:hypothetical protein